MTRALAAAVLAAAALGVAGCHAAADTPGPAGTQVTGADPLAGVEARLSAIERGLAADATG